MANNIQISANTIFLLIQWILDTTKETLYDVFGEFGTVSEIYVPQDRDSGRSRGFAFVSMSTQEELDAVLGTLSETNIDDRTVYVTKARSKAEKVKRDSKSITISREKNCTIYFTN